MNLRAMQKVQGACATLLAAATTQDKGQWSAKMTKQEVVATVSRRNLSRGGSCSSHHVLPHLCSGHLVFSDLPLASCCHRCVQFHKLKGFCLFVCFSQVNLRELGTQFPRPSLPQPVIYMQITALCAYRACRASTAHALLPSCEVQQFAKASNKSRMQPTSHQELTCYKPRGRNQT